MSVKDTQKNNQDWHKEDIKAALAKKGWSMRQLALKHGYSSGSTLTQVFYRSFPKAEKIIADELGLTPEEIWPSRVVARNHKKIVGINV